MLPAAHGDALWIEVGPASKPRRILVDGGTAPTYAHIHSRITALDANDRHFDLLVVTHVDADHIEGIVRLLGDRQLGASFADIWFNGWRHLGAADTDTLGPVQGEILSALIDEFGHPWNAAFGGGPVVLPAAGSPPTVDVNGLRLTVLSPGPEQLMKLRATWATEVRRAGLEPGVAKQALAKLAATKKLQGLTLGEERIAVRALAAAKTASDGAVANGSSIALLAEFGEQRILLGADAHPDVLAAGLDRLLIDRGLETLAIDAFKLPHHASAANVTLDVLRLVRCPRFLVSTNGDVFNHPDPEAIARVIVHGGGNPELWFNYRSEETLVWDDDALASEHRYKAIFPHADDSGLALDLAPTEG